MLTNRKSKLPSATLCITDLDVGGAEKALARIAIGLRDSGWDIRVISLRDAGPVTELLQADDIPVTALQCNRLFDIRAFFRLRAALQRHPTDVLLSFLYQANFYGRLAGRAAGIPCIVSGVRVADRRRWVILTDSLTRCCTDHYVAVSPHVAQTHAAMCGIPSDKITAIPNGVDCPGTETSSGADPGSNLVLFVGRLTEQKDPLNLLNSFADLPASVRSQFRLEFVGDGPLRDQLDRKIHEFDLSEKVTLSGRTDDVSRKMRSATVLVVPSKWEGMPNVILEAMSVGLPVIATAVDGCNDLITQHETGWLVPQADSQSLASALEFALTQPSARRSVAQKAQAVVQKDFSWASVVLQYDHLLRSLLPSSTPSKTS